MVTFKHETHDEEYRSKVRNIWDEGSQNRFEEEMSKRCEKDIDTLRKMKPSELVEKIEKLCKDVAKDAKVTRLKTSPYRSFYTSDWFSGVYVGDKIDHQRVRTEYDKAMKKYMSSLSKRDQGGVS